MKKEDPWIERRIVTGLIVSDEYIRGVAGIWRTELLQSATARILAGWCVDYFKQYNRAPGRDIQGIYTAHLKNGLEKERATDIETILNDLSEEYERGKFNVDYLNDESMKYFATRHLREHISAIQGELDTGSITEAEKLATGYNQITRLSKNVIDPFTPDAIALAFQERAQPLIYFGKALGGAWDAQFTRDAFIAFMGPEKRGKSQLLLEVAMRSLMSNCNTVFFQAGDMSEAQQIKRICTYLAKKSPDPKYCDALLIPVIDCKRNQNDICSRKDRQGTCGLNYSGDLDELSYDMLREVYERNKKTYAPCDIHGCEDQQHTIWFKKRNAVEPLTEEEARRIIHKFRRRYKRQFKLVTYPNETLTVGEIKSLLDTWERTELFVPDVIVIDYADILAADSDCSRMEYRHQENRKWQRLRSLSQQRHCLLVTATQTDADSYNRQLLTMDNFSETKTKYAHVTAMYGLNQTDREKKLGLMRINEIVVREGDFDRSTAVCILQRLQIGRPYLGSF